MASDDTEHACLTAQALIESGLDPAWFERSLAWRLRWWLVRLPPATGLATARAIVRLWLGVPPERSGVDSAGNGAAMRAPVLGLVRDAALRRELVRRSTRMTHRDARAEHGAQVVACAVALAMDREAPLEPRRVREAILRECPDLHPEIAEQVRAACASVEAGESTAAFVSRTMDERGRRGGRGVSGFINHTLGAVVHAWLSHPLDYRAAVEGIVRCGGDTDTTAALVGALVGVRVGRDRIPDEWRRGFCDWPQSLGWIERLGGALARSTDTNQPARAPKVPCPLLVARNLVFLLIVLAHGFARLWPW